MFRFNIFKKYFFIEYSKIVLNVTLAFLALGIVLNIFEEVNFFKDHAVGFLLPLSLTFLKVPSIIYKLFPFIFLISSIILFLNFFQSEEVIAIKIAGISNFRIILFPAIISLIFGIIIVTGINTVTSKLTHKYLDIKNEYTQDNDYLAALTENGTSVSWNDSSSVRLIVWESSSSLFNCERNSCIFSGSFGNVSFQSSGVVRNDSTNDFCCKLNSE